MKKKFYHKDPVIKFCHIWKREYKTGFKYINRFSHLAEMKLKEPNLPSCPKTTEGDREGHKTYEAFFETMDIRQQRTVDPS